MWSFLLDIFFFIIAVCCRAGSAFLVIFERISGHLINVESDPNEEEENYGTEETIMGHYYYSDSQI